jgi:hypothetical protein
MLKSIHILLSYTCTWECDHCFLYCGPDTEGTFTIGQIKSVLDEAVKIGTVSSVYFEGGEPFLYYPLMLAAIHEARVRNIEVGIVTNAYWAITVDDARLWLAPLVDYKISDLSISDDKFHQESDNNTAKNARAAAKALRLPVGTICIDPPSVALSASIEHKKGEPVVGGGVMFKGRAADKLTTNLPRRPRALFKECPHEDLIQPERVHIDCFGNVQLCQGIVLGNMWKTQLSRLISEYRAENHPIAGPLTRGGPEALARMYGVDVGNEFVDECHMCFLVRRVLVDRFPEYLAPRHVYGIK